MLASALSTTSGGRPSERPDTTIVIDNVQQFRSPSSTTTTTTLLPLESFLRCSAARGCGYCGGSGSQSSQISAAAAAAAAARRGCDMRIL